MDAKEAIPVNAAEPQEKEVDVCMFVDSNHAGDRVSHWSRNGFLICVNTALESTVETSIFGAEFVAIKKGVDALRGLKYKLRMMGIPTSGPSYIYGDNVSVVHNTSRPESVLRKKSNSFCSNVVCESVAMGGALVGYMPSKDHGAD